jgi:hypothetical protein
VLGFALSADDVNFELRRSQRIALLDEQCIEALVDLAGHWRSWLNVDTPGPQADVLTRRWRAAQPEGRRRRIASPLVQQRQII